MSKSNPIPAAPVAVGVEQAARMLAIPRTAVFSLLKTGELASAKIGRRRVIRVDEIKRFVQDREARQPASNPAPTMRGAA